MSYTEKQCSFGGQSRVNFQRSLVVSCSILTFLIDIFAGYATRPTRN